MNTEKSREQRAAQREQLKKVAEDAVLEWVTGLLQQAKSYSQELLEEGEDAILIYSGAWTGEDNEQEELRSIKIANTSKKVELLPGDLQEDAWYEGALLWTELRDALASLHGTETPASLVIDVSKENLLGYEPTHCNTCGPAPSLVGCMESLETKDPFASLLLNDEDKAEEVVSRIEELMTFYSCEAPTSPGAFGCEEEEDF